MNSIKNNNLIIFQNDLTNFEIIKNLRGFPINLNIEY